MMTGSSCSSSSTKVVLVVPGFPSFFVHFSLSTYDCRLVQNYQLSSGSVKVWGFLHFGYRLQSCSSSSFVLHSPFPHMLQQRKKLKRRRRGGDDDDKIFPKFYRNNLTLSRNLLLLKSLSVFGNLFQIDAILEEIHHIY